MFGTIKKWMGIEGVRLRLHLLSAYPKTVETINGEVELYAKSNTIVRNIRLQLIETYTRGKAEEKRVDEYLMGTWELDQPLHMREGENQRLLFKLPFEWLESPMDRRAKSNPLLKGMVSLMKNRKGVLSEYRLEAQVEVEGQGWSEPSRTRISFED